jgi:hypothetical protein
MHSRSIERTDELSRRHFLRCGCATLAVVAGVPAFSAGPALGAGRLIGIHHHIFPPAMIDALKEKLPPFSLPGVDR